MASSSMTITAATEADVATLAEIQRLAYLVEAIAPFFFSDFPNPMTMSKYFEARIQERLSNPNTETLKVTETATSEIIAFVSRTYVDGEQPSAGDGSKPEGVKARVPPAGVNLEFAQAVLRDLGRLESVMNGKEHFLISSLAIRPDFQLKGVGTYIMRHCLRKPDLTGLPAYLNAFPGAHGFYKRMGFEVIDTADIDLGEWGTKFRGYGVYRSYAMLYHPGASTPVA